MIWVELAIAVIGLAYGLYSAKRAKRQHMTEEPSFLSNVRIQSSTYGGPIPFIYGRNRVSANFIWYGGFTPVPHSESTGGKGGGGGVTTTWYTYTVSVAMALGYGLISNVARIFRDKKIITGKVQSGSTQYSAAEAYTVPAGSPHTVTVINAGYFTANLGVAKGAVTLTPGADYSVAAGVYTITNAAYWGQVLTFSYSYTVNASWLSALAEANLSLFTGSAAQSAWTYLTTNFAGQNLAYRNLAYIAAQNYDLGDTATFGNHSFEVDGNLQYGPLTSQAQTFTATLATSRINTGTALATGTAVKLSSTGVLPYFLQSNITYFVVNASGLTAQLALYKNGDPYGFSSAGGAGSGTHTVTPQIVDANPKDVVNDLLTDPIKGADFPAASVGSLTAFSNYAVASGLFVSPYFDGQRSAADMIAQLLAIANSVCYFSEGLLKIVPLGDAAVTGNGVTYTPNVTPVYALTDDDYQPAGGADPLVCERRSQSDAYNHVQVKFRNRANHYNEEVVEAKDQASIDQYGLRTMSPITVDEICELSIARAFAQMVLQRVLYLRNMWRFRLPIKYMLLEPTDIVTLTDSVLGLANYPVRILAIEEALDRTLVVDAEDFPGNVSSIVQYQAQLSAGVASNFNVDPGSVDAPLIMEGPGILTVSGFELWVALSGGASWGGANIFVSTDRSNYVQRGVVYGSSRYGVLTATFPSGANPDTTNTASVDLSISDGVLLNGTVQDADQFSTLCYVDGELIAYTVAQLTALNKYDLITYTRRGVYNTPISAHALGASFARLDDAIGKVSYDPALIGATIYLKFPSFNIHGFNPQDLADCVEYSYVIGGGLGAPDNVTGFSATQQGNLVMFTWNLLPAANISGYEIRYLPLGVAGLTWNDATELTKVTKGTQVTSARLPPGAWTCLIKAVDTSLRYSNTAATADVGMVNTYQVIEARPQSPAWAGTKVNCEGHYLGNLYPLSNSLASAGATGWEVFDQYVYDVVSSFSYTSEEIDLGRDGQFRTYGIPISRVGPGVSGTAHVSSYIRYRTAAGAYAAYAPWGIGSVTARYFQFQLQGTNPAAPVVSAFTPTADNPKLVQSDTLTVPSGGITVTFPTAYFDPPQVTGGAVGATNTNMDISAITSSSFFILARNAATGADAGPVTANWQATGV